MFILSAAALLLSARPLLAQAADAPHTTQDHLSHLPLEDLLDIKVFAAWKFEQEIGQAPAEVAGLPAIPL